jgi:hypothetical protein
VITANLSAFFIEDGDDHVARQLEEMSDRLSRMEALLQERVTRDRDQGPSHS